MIKKTSRFVRVPVRVLQEDADWIKEEAIKEGIKVSLKVRRLLRQYLKATTVEERS